tara:strand:- start:7025 stop:7780 length:756 start_codon:yes stop_codon:yes gene_type:complete
MKRLAAIILSLFPILLVVFFADHGVLRAPASGGLKHVVFDLDGTLVESLGHNIPGDIVLESGEAYHVFPHARELVEKVWKSGAKVHFYSGGPNERNLDLLSKLKLSNGQSFTEIASSILGREDLIDLGEHVEGEYFTDRYRKDLTKIGDLESLIIVEDNKFFPLDQAQRARVLELPIHDGGPLKQWRGERRLTWAYEVMDDVLAGKPLEEINHVKINETIIESMRKLGESVRGDLSRHGCAGIFYSLQFSL